MNWNPFKAIKKRHEARAAEDEELERIARHLANAPYTVKAHMADAEGTVIRVHVRGYVWKQYISTEPLKWTPWPFNGEQTFLERVKENPHAVKTHTPGFFLCMSQVESYEIKPSEEWSDYEQFKHEIPER